jgi:2-methylisocitrate lyase-like PEP mutase family enzyme
VAAQRHGLPDIGLIAFKEMSEAVHAVCRVSSLPIIVDCDTGYGGILNVRQTVREFESAGAAGVQIEDQCWPKRCGHMQSKMIEPIKTAVDKIDAAVRARRNDDLVIVARTDARDVLGFDEALRRCKAYKAAGADMVCFHGPRSIEELRILAAEIEGPHMVCIGEGEFTDGIEVAELFRLGFQFGLLPSSILRTATFAVSAMLQNIKERAGGERGDTRPCRPRCRDLC